MFHKARQNRRPDEEGIKTQDGEKFAIIGVRTVDLMKKGLRLLTLRFLARVNVRTVDLMKKGLRHDQYDDYWRNNESEP